MKKTILLCAAGMWIAFAAVSAQEATVKRLIELGKTDNRVMNHLDVLTNRFGGRPIGSDAYDNAVDWVASRFGEWGLEVELNEGGTVPVGFNRGPWQGRMLGGEREMALHFVTPSYSSGTKGLQRGHVLLEPKTREEFDRMKGALKGAWVLVTGKSIGWAIAHDAAADSVRASVMARNGEIRRRNRETAENNRLKNRNDSLLTLLDEPALFYREMREAGILGIIQSAPVPLVALYDRCVVKDSTMTFDRLPELPDI
ncbi:MAG: peptidase M28, partial [Tannerella sp.]|nr:peptidase M28 [Tannerella sp.]